MSEHGAVPAQNSPSGGFVPADLPPADRPPADLPPADRPPADLPAADLPSADQARETLGHGVVKIAAVAAIGGLLFGYDSGVINGATDALQEYFDIGSEALGFAVASALLGAAVGAVFAGRLADRFGRLYVMRVAAVLFLISAIGTAVAPSLWVLVLFRVIGGLGVGVASVIAPAYIAEIAPAGIRGRLASLQQLAIVFGLFLSAVVNWLIQHAAGGADQDFWFGWEAWRWMFFVMLVPAVVYGTLSLTIPESPRFQVARGRIGEARTVLTGVLGSAGIDKTMQSIEDSLRSEKPPAWKDLVTRRTGLLPIVWVGVALSMFQQFVGINVIFYYSNTLWHAVGFSTSDSFLITTITNVINIVVTLIAIGMIDRIGRKPLLIIGSIGMTVTLGVMAAMFGTASLDAEGQPVLSGASGPIALVAGNLFVVAFGLSWGPAVWVLLGEMFPNKIRASALSLAAAAQWVANWAITESFPTLKDASLGLAYGLYAGFAALSYLFVVRFVRETKGIELEDMDGSVERSSGPAVVEAT